LKNPPSHLSTEARRFWSELIAEYGIDDPAGVAILTQACEAHDRVTEARKAIAKDGASVVDRFGQPKAHPLLTVERDARAAFLAALKALNLDLEPLRDGPGRPPRRN
jgi:P27 family predicted phage terminase small subunit